MSKPIQHLQCISNSDSHAEYGFTSKLSPGEVKEEIERMGGLLPKGISHANHYVESALFKNAVIPDWWLLVVTLESYENNSA